MVIYTSIPSKISWLGQAVTFQCNLGPVLTGGFRRLRDASCSHGCP